MSEEVEQTISDETDLQRSNGHSPDRGHQSWLTAHLRPGRIACLGPSFTIPINSDAYRVSELRDLSTAGTAGRIFDHAWVNGVTGALDPIALAWRLFHIVAPGGTVVITVPFGLSEQAGHSPFYVGSLRRLVEPLFEIVDMYVEPDRISVIGQRRDAPVGAPSGALHSDEQAFYAHDINLNAQLRSIRAELVQSGARYRALVVRAEKLQNDLKRKDRELAQLRQKMAKVRRVLRIPLAIRRRLLRLKAATAHRWSRAVGGPDTKHSRPAAPPQMVEASLPGQQVESQSSGAIRAMGVAGRTSANAVIVAPPWRDVLDARFKAWLAAARAAAGDEVVIMFSGTTFVQEQRGNRPIRLTNVYLARHCPVFFNYYRAGESEPLPEHPDELLCQSPIDATQALLDDLLTADFGDKKKILFVSFPHEMMVRYMMLAAQYGWATVYDVRDDWEEFAKVGMAKWYSPSFERYVAKFADVVTAVSRPLARKIQVVSGGRDVHVVPNALDTRFPRPIGPRTPSNPPVIGYFGHLTDKWFDWPLLITAAKRYPAYRFELAGHQHPKDLRLPPNVELLGLVGHAELAERSRAWSVALIPFKNGPLADAVDPIKIYEYLHLRVPVLATYFPQCRDYPGTTITEGREEFIERLGALVGTELRDDEIMAWLAHNTWEQRVDQYSALTEKVRRRGRDKLATVVGGDL